MLLRCAFACLMVGGSIFSLVAPLHGAPLHGAQLRVVTWNTLGEARTGTADVLQAIGLEEVGGFAGPIDVLSLQEQSSGDTATILAALNGLYGPGSYAAAPTPPNAETGGAGLPGLVYRVDTIDLLETVAFGVVDSSNQARSTLRYQIRPDGYGADAEFYLYANHYKASAGSSNEHRRNLEATAVRADLDALGEGISAILTGDFNIRSSTEAMYQTLLAPGPGQVFDPIDTPGTWHNNSALRFTHTQSPVTSSNFPGQVTGGVDDRFDFQLITGELLDGLGLDFIEGSYRAFGNNGTHVCCNSPLTGSGASPEILAALRQASDHLPVVADYRLPELGLAGDYNFDGVVDALDYATWRERLGDPFDAADFLVWQENYGATLSAGQGSVGLPEPASLLMAGLVATFLVASGLRQRAWIGSKQQPQFCKSGCA